MAQSRIENDLHVSGALTCKSFTPPAGSMDDQAIKAGAKVQASKLQHQHRLNYAQPNVAAVAETKAVYVCYGAAGTIKDFRAGSIVKCTGNATITVDLKKNGTTVLQAPITLDSTNQDRVAEAGTVTTSALAAGDLLEVVVTASAGTGALGTGLFAVLTVEEDAQ